MQGSTSWPFGPRRSCLRVNPPPVSTKVPSQRFSFRDNLSFVEWRKYRTRCDCQFARHFTPHMSPFRIQFGFEPSKCPSASTDTSVQSKKKKKQKNSKKKVRRRTERRRQQQRGGKFQKTSILLFTLIYEDKLPLWLIDKPIKQ